jgi:hypothetical protein
VISFTARLTVRQPEQNTVVIRVSSFGGILFPKPASLELDRPLRNRLYELTEKIGGVPRLIVTKTGDPPLQFDMYGDATIREIFSSFQRCRRSVCRTHICFIARDLYNREPDTFKGIPKNVRTGLLAYMTEVFWEHAEISYIRLASFWDRIGQFLDFVFFIIRQYKSDGFPSVMDRIHSNYMRLIPELASSSFWTELRKYQTSEKTDGFQWLVRRRNLASAQICIADLR